MDMKAVRVKFNEACQTNESRISEIHQEHRVNPRLPEHFHHYTTIDGLHGILKSREVWGTSVEYLNDSVEISYGMDLAKDVVNQEIKGNAGDDNLVIQVQLFRILAELEHHRSNTSYFVTCFCEAPDLLSQWRAYGKNAGYSLNVIADKFYSSVSSLNEDALRQGGTSPRRAAYMERVIYDPEVQGSLLSKVLRSCVDAYRELAMGEDFLGEEKRSPMDKDFYELTERFSKYAARQALRFVSQFKHPAFAEEKEWRLVHRRDAFDYGGVEFRTANGRLIPYVKMKFDLDESLESITCGPPSSQLSMNSIKTFMSASGLKHKPLVAANAPLRL
jgi:hypothetical protein